MTNRKDAHDGAARHDDADATRERIAKAWAELLEAAKTDPKARAFLAAFGPTDAPPAADGAHGAHGTHVADGADGADRVDGADGTVRVDGAAQRERDADGSEDSIRTD